MLIKNKNKIILTGIVFVAGFLIIQSHSTPSAVALSCTTANQCDTTGYGQEKWTCKSGTCQAAYCGDGFCNSCEFSPCASRTESPGNCPQDCGSPTPTPTPTPTPSPSTYSDSDGGANLYVKGTTIGLVGGTKATMIDACLSSQLLTEYTLDSGNNIKTHTVACNYGCSNGTCAQNGSCTSSSSSSSGTGSSSTGSTSSGGITIGTCNDSDGGFNYGTRGTSSGTQFWNGAAGNLTDYCMGDDQNLIEFFCTADGKLYWEKHLCASGCLDGICVGSVTSSSSSSGTGSSSSSSGSGSGTTTDPSGTRTITVNYNTTTGVGSYDDYPNINYLNPGQTKYFKLNVPDGLGQVRIGQASQDQGTIVKVFVQKDTAANIDNNYGAARQIFGSPGNGYPGITKDPSRTYSVTETTNLLLAAGYQTAGNSFNFYKSNPDQWFGYGNGGTVTGDEVRIPCPRGGTYYFILKSENATAQSRVFINIKFDPYSTTNKYMSSTCRQNVPW